MGLQMGTNAGAVAANYHLGKKLKEFRKEHGSLSQWLAYRTAIG